jgi:hypothetical protein
MVTASPSGLVNSITMAQHQAHAQQAQPGPPHLSSNFFSAAAVAAANSLPGKEIFIFTHQNNKVLLFENF